MDAKRIVRLKINGEVTEAELIGENKAVILTGASKGREVTLPPSYVSAQPMSPEQPTEAELTSNIPAPAYNHSYTPPSAEWQNSDYANATEQTESVPLQQREKAEKTRKEKKEKQFNQKAAKGNLKFISEENSLIRKKVTLAFVYIIAIAVILFVAVSTLTGLQKEIEVVRVCKSLTAGALITENSIESFPMLKSTYDQLGTVIYTNPEGDKIQKYSMILWEDKDSVVGKYASNYIQVGQLISELSVTDKTIIKNPWLSKANDGDEVYTMPFRASDINLNLLYVGTPLRVRAVMKGGNKSSSTVINGNFDEPVDENSDNSVSNMTPNISGMTTTDKDGNKSEFSAEVIFEELITVDMLNAKGESIFELYMDLLSLPIEERARHLETKIEKEQTTFKEKVTPVSLVFLLTREQADEFAKFEAAKESVDLKYTILARRDEEGELINALIEINKELQRLMSDMNIIR